MSRRPFPGNNADLSDDVSSEALAREEASEVSNDGAKPENAVIADNGLKGSAAGAWRRFFLRRPTKVLSMS